MLTSSPSHFQFHAFLPAIPSPLSPRSANIYGPRNFMSASESEREKRVPFAQRATKKAPSPRPEELKERRRKIFLRKVEERRDEKRFEGRGDDILRLDFVQREREREARLALEAPTPDVDVVEEQQEDEETAYDAEWNDLPMPDSSNTYMLSQASAHIPEAFFDFEVEERERREREELELLVASMEDTSDSREFGKEKYGEEHLYSDDEDYEKLFEEIIQRDAATASMMYRGEDKTQTSQANAESEGDPMDMDMS